MRSRRPWVVAAVACAAPLTACALEFSARKVTAEVLDDDTGRPLSGVGYIVRESNTVQRLPSPIPYAPSGPRTSCLRATTMRHSTNPSVVLTLDAVEVDARDKLLSSGTSLEIYAYAPGYCIAELNETRRSRLSITAKDGSAAGVTSSFEPRTQRAVLRTRRDTSDPEQRIRYLRASMIAIDACDSKGADLEAGAIRREIEAEIKALEKSLPIHETGRGFAIVPASQEDRVPNWNARNGACAPGDGCSTIAASQVYPQGVTPPPSRPLRIICKEADCDFGRRYKSGKTALYQYIHAADPERVAVLLQAGADPNVELYPGGPTGIDVLLDGLPLSGERTELALRTVQAIVADGRATVSARTAKRLASPWAGQLEEIRRLAASLPHRPPGPPAICRPVPYKLDWGLPGEEY